MTSALQEASHDHPVVVLTGARQVGKSTLLNAEPFRNWRFHTLDDFAPCGKLGSGQKLCGPASSKW